MGIIHEIREMFRALRYKGELEPSTKYCPRCSSPKLRSKTNWFIVPSQTYKCLNCGYEGPIFMEKE
jgi:transposase-like protein